MTSIVPTHWYNVLSDLADVEDAARLRRARPAEGPRPADGAITPQIPLTMYRQSLSREPFIEIPEEVRRQYLRWRPTPLRRARNLEQLLRTPARIYFKYEGTSPTGSHKLNTALAQAYYYKQAGVEELTTGTGAGQWGSALSLAARIYGLRCTVYMVRVSHEQKPYRRVMMEMNGARVVPSPSTGTSAGRAALERDPDTGGSLSIANAEAFEHAAARDRCNLSVGSGENHVLLHQTVIGQEALRQLEALDEFPDVVIGAVGAGSNFSGLAFPFFHEKIRTGRATRFVAVEPQACPKLTKGTYAWDYNDFTGVTPMTKMYTLGHTFVSPGIHAGGLRYHGAAPLVSAMYDQKLIEAVAYPQQRVFEAGLTFAEQEWITPAPESAHAIRAAIDEAVRAREEGREKVILFNLSGHGLLDLSAYDHYLSGRMTDLAATEDQIRASLDRLPPQTDARPAAHAGTPSP
ncbi:TrpB-like pyridoxal phosphate-dependent enzyme [Streptomyces sp. LN245]|uniref:TrpB-like pyridoxal phosphate-dependent enzyme n=1 Tax=Streptomyces sp. LN245 TaxID=3112975 RepID=UPI003721841C